MAQVAELLVSISVPLPRSYGLAFHTKLTINFPWATKIVICFDQAEETKQRPTNIVEKTKPSRSRTIARSTAIALEDDRSPSVRVIGPSDKETEILVNAVCEGLKAGHAPQLISEGEGGAYRMFDKSGNIVGVFKPTDEEIMCSSNPKKHPDSPTRKGILPGEGAHREVAAYYLGGDAAGVPPTALVEIRNSSLGPAKTGSLQRWVDSTSSTEDLGPGCFSVSDVHRIGILDIVLANTDRHEGNLLVTREGRLVPIDHGFCLPSSLEELYFCWMNWPQAKMPFDADALRFISSLSVEELSRRLRDLSFRAECIETLRITTEVLKRGAARHLSLHQIATLLCRTDPQRPSRIEACVQAAAERSGGLRNEEFWTRLAELIEEEVSLLSRQ